MIITLDDYKSYAGIANPKSDEKLQFIVDFVNDYITNYCNTSFSSVIRTGVKVTSINGFDVVLPDAPVISIEEIRVAGVVLASDSYSKEDLSSGIVESYSTFPTTRFGIEIDYTHGHVTVPRDLILSALEFVTHLHKREFTKSRNLGNGESADYGDPELIPSQIRLGLNVHKVL